MLQLGFPFLEKKLDRLLSLGRRNPELPKNDVQLWKHGISVRIISRPRARRYLLRLQLDGTARLVIPRRGTRREALRFLDCHEPWLLQRFREWQTRTATRRVWTEGTTFLFRGESAMLQVVDKGGSVELRFADQVFAAPAESDYRTRVLAHLRRLAEIELPPRTRELAQIHGIQVQRISVRAQKTRWGSCSARGTISLNWRLVQAPRLVRDYLIIHELMHRRQMNHSARYWKLVAEAFPEYRAAEQWLKKTRLEAMD